jgi:glycosyltransferase involved in cell wall biosynthesis
MTVAPCRLRDLPAGPPGKTGWPWTEETAPLPATAPGGKSWPRISIVTPNYNYGAYLEAAIRSVILQGYPNLEYFVIDGGSSDRSVEILRKYEPWLTYWESERDRGQTHAINKGLARCTGEVVNWLCSDDMLMPGALEAIGRCFAASPDVDVVLGRTQHRWLGDPSRDRVDRPTLQDIADLPAIRRVALFQWRTLYANRSTGGEGKQG